MADKVKDALISERSRITRRLLRLHRLPSDSDDFHWISLGEALVVVLDDEQAALLEDPEIVARIGTFEAPK